MSNIIWSKNTDNHVCYITAGSSTQIIRALNGYSTLAVDAAYLIDPWVITRIVTVKFFINSRNYNKVIR